MLAAVVRFDHASDITLAELWIELLFPTDAPTRRWFETAVDTVLGPPSSSRNLS